MSKLMMLFPCMLKNDWGLGLGSFFVCLNNLVLTHIQLNVLNWHMNHLSKIGNKLVIRTFFFFLLFYHVNSCFPTTILNMFYVPVE